MARFPNQGGEGFIELALVILLVGIVVIVIVALLGPELTAFLQRFIAFLTSAA